MVHPTFKCSLSFAPVLFGMLTVAQEPGLSIGGCANTIGQDGIRQLVACIAFTYGNKIHLFLFLECPPVSSIRRVSA